MSNIAQIQTIATPIEVALRWSDQDVNGHINNVRLLTLIEEARIRATQQWTNATPGTNGPKRIVRAMNTSFTREVHYGSDTTIWVWIPRIGRTSIVFGQLLTQDNQPCVYSEATMVMVDAKTGFPMPHDAQLLQQLEPHTGASFLEATD